MIPRPFAYHRPNTLEEAVALLEQYGGEARVLAGGHSLLPAMKLRLAAPAALVDIGRIPGLAGIREEGDALVIGALTPHRELERSALLARYWPAFPDAARVIGDRQVRNRGTIGGSLAHADPAADLPAVCLAAGATLTAVGPRGARTIPVDAFFQGLFATALEPTDILTEIRVPKPGPRAGSAYLKHAVRASDFAIVGAAAAVELDEEGRLLRVRIGVSGVAYAPYRATAVEEALSGRTPDPDALREAARRAAEDVEAMDNAQASAEYRRAMAAVFVGRALERAVERARAAAAAA